MSKSLDVPDGLQATSVADPDGLMVEFYTGRWPIRFDRSEVMELIDALQSWLAETAPKPDENSP